MNKKQIEEVRKYNPELAKIYEKGAREDRYTGIGIVIAIILFGLLLTVTDSHFFR